MIASVQGKIVQQGEGFLVILVGGIGLHVNVPRTVFDRVEGIGHTIQLSTHLDVKEDSLTLYGFNDDDERATFNTITNVSGVGPKIALSIMSTLTTSQLRTAVASEDATMLTRVPGIGKKKAEKIVFELKDKLKLDGPAELTGLIDIDSDVLDTLVALGYSIIEAQAAIQSIPRDAPDTIEERVLIALNYFN